MIRFKHKTQPAHPAVPAEALGKGWELEGSSGIDPIDIKSGFTLLETLFATVIFTLVMSPLFFMQGEMLQRVARISRHMQRIFVMQEFLFDARKQLKKDTTQLSLEKQIDNPPTIVRYQLGAVDGKSALHNIKGLYTERVTAVWSTGNRRTDDTLVTLRCIKPEQQP